MIVLFGATGYVGQAFADELRRRRARFVPLSRQTVDCSDFARLFDYLRQLNPEFVINAAGCVGGGNGGNGEDHRSMTLEANTVFPQNLARACALTNTPLGHVSSGAVFSGGKLAARRRLRVVQDLSRPLVRRLLMCRPELLRGFNELDKPNQTFQSPSCGLYPGSKALAEELLSDWDTVYIWRPGVMFDEVVHPRNFLCGFHCPAAAGDSFNSFTHRGDFVRACLDLWEQRAPFGTYHVVNPGPLTPRKIMQRVRRLFRPERHEGLLDGQCCASMDEAILPRSAGCVLDASKLEGGGVTMRSAVKALEDSIRKWRPVLKDAGRSLRPRRPIPTNGWGHWLRGTVTPE